MNRMRPLPVVAGIDGTSPARTRKAPLVLGLTALLVIVAGANALLPTRLGGALR